MSAQNWLRLVVLSVFWGGSFFFVEVGMTIISAGLLLIDGCVLRLVQRKGVSL